MLAIQVPNRIIITNTSKRHIDNCFRDTIPYIGVDEIDEEKGLIYRTDVYKQHIISILDYETATKYYKQEIDK